MRWFREPPRCAPCCSSCWYAVARPWSSAPRAWRCICDGFAETIPHGNVLWFTNPMKQRLPLLTLLLASALLPAQVKVTPDGDRIHVEINGKPFTDFVLKEGEAMKPYLNPIHTASGKLITRHLPGELVAGEP